MTIDWDALDRLPLQEQVRRLTDYIVELEAKLEAKVSESNTRSGFAGLGLSRSEEQIARLLASTGHLARSRVVVELYGHRLEADQPADAYNLSSVFMHRVRDKLHRLAGVTVITVWGQGWRVAPEDLVKLQALRDGLAVHTHVEQAT